MVHSREEPLWGYCASNRPAMIVSDSKGATGDRRSKQEGGGSAAPFLLVLACPSPGRAPSVLGSQQQPGRGKGGGQISEVLTAEHKLQSDSENCPQTRSGREERHVVRSPHGKMTP